MDSASAQPPRPKEAPSLPSFKPSSVPVRSAPAAGVQVAPAPAVVAEPLERPVKIWRIQDMDNLKDEAKKVYKKHYSEEQKKWKSEPSLNSPKCEFRSRVRTQYTPFGANRWLLLILALVAVLIRGCTYWGWNGLQDMLYKSGAFSWQCDAALSPTLRIGSGVYSDCPERKESINNLYTMAFACNFIFSAFGGYVLDRIGPRATLAGAIVMDIAGWTLLAIASETVQTYIPALMLIGMAADPGFLALLCTANLFPNREGTVMGVMGAVRSLSFAVPVVMAAIYERDNFGEQDLWKVVVVYVGVLLTLCLVICAFFVPAKPFKGAEDFRREHRENRLQHLKEKTLSLLPDSFYRSCHHPLEPEQEEQQEQQRYNLVLTKEQHEEVFTAMSETESQGAQPAEELSLRGALKDPRFLLLLPVFVVNLLRVEFYTKSNKEQLSFPDGENLFTFFSMMNILTFLPGLAMGYITDLVGIVPVLSGLNIAGIGMYAFVMPLNKACKTASVVFFWLYASFVLSSIYCYIKLRFPNKLFGTLAGLCSLVGGCFALTSLGWYKLSTETLLSLAPKNFWPVDGGMIAAGLVAAGILYVLSALDKRSKQQAKVKKETKRHRIGKAANGVSIAAEQQRDAKTEDSVEMQKAQEV